MKRISITVNGEKYDEHVPQDAACSFPETNWLDWHPHGMHPEGLWGLYSA